MVERDDGGGSPPMGRVQTRIRMDQSLFEQIEKSAQESGRSLNSEIVRRLEQSFRHEWEAEMLARQVEKSELRFDALMDLIVKMARPGQMLEEAVAKVEREDAARKEQNK